MADFRQKWFRARFDLNFDILLFVLVFICVVVNVWLWLNGVQSGFIYSVLFIIPLSLTTFLNILLKGDFEDTFEFIKSSLSNNLTQSCLFFLIGFTLPFLIKFILGIAKSSFSVVSLSIPLFGNSLSSQVTQSFSVVNIQESPVWFDFIIGLDAGTIETVTYAFLIPLFFILIWFLITKRESKKSELTYGAVLFGIVMGALIFSASHVFNGNYNSTAGIDYNAFAVALIFQIIVMASLFLPMIWNSSNLLIKSISVLVFWIGFHTANNFNWIIDTKGLAFFLKGFESWFGVVFIGLILFMLYYVISNFDNINSNSS